MLVDMDIFSLSMRGRRGVILALILIVLGGAACAPLVRAPGAPLRRLTTLPNLTDDGDRASLAAAAGESLHYFERLPPDRVITFGTTKRTVAEMRAAMTGLLTLLATDPSPAVLTSELGRRFEVYRVTTPAGVLFTGYYLPTLAASTARDARFRIPVLGRPPDLVTVPLGDLGAPCACREQVVGRVVRGTLAPYFTRAEIDSNAVDAAPLLAWVEDAVGLFFLQIQGSGVLAFADGSRRTIGFAATNGHPYVSIGRVLVERGELTLDQASMQGIRRWIEIHPDEGDRLLQTNPRYVFFRQLDGPPLGSLGVPVTPGRTIATDPVAFPPGTLGFVHISAQGPIGTLSRLVFNQDAGAAIRGPGRVDVYFGAGSDAEITAGRLRSPGELYFLAPRTPALR